MTPKSLALGRVFSTRGAIDRVPSGELLIALIRHANGDWGCLDEEDRRANDNALIDGARILSAYCSRDHVKFWIITEADRSTTTILLPDDY
jgi:hypothetical protein